MEKFSLPNNVAYPTPLAIHVRCEMQLQEIPAQTPIDATAFVSEGGILSG